MTHEIKKKVDSLVYCENINVIHIFDIKLDHHFDPPSSALLPQLLVLVVSAITALEAVARFCTQVALPGIQMVGQQRPSFTSDSLQRLRQAEQKVISALNHAAQATRTLSTAIPSQATSFSTQSESFLKEMYAAQALVRQQIELVEIDRPYENPMLRRLIDADISVQRTAHIHRALVRILAALEEPCEGLSTAASPGYMPSPVASTPGLGGLGGIAPSPLTAGAPIVVAVPSPANDGAAGLSAQVGLNGGLAEGAETQDLPAEQTNP